MQINVTLSIPETLDSMVASTALAMIIGFAWYTLKLLSQQAETNKALTQRVAELSLERDVRQGSQDVVLLGPSVRPELHLSRATAHEAPAASSKREDGPLPTPKGRGFLGARGFPSTTVSTAIGTRRPSATPFARREPTAAANISPASATAHSPACAIELPQVTSASQVGPPPISGQPSFFCVVFGAINMDVKATAELANWPQHDVICAGRFEAWRHTCIQQEHAHARVHAHTAHVWQV